MLAACSACPAEMLLGLDQKWPLSQFILPVLMEHLWEHVLPVQGQLSDYLTISYLSYLTAGTALCHGSSLLKGLQ